MYLFLNLLLNIYDILEQRSFWALLLLSVLLLQLCWTPFLSSNQPLAKLHFILKVASFSWLPLPPLRCYQCFPFVIGPELLWLPSSPSEKSNKGKEKLKLSTVLQQTSPILCCRKGQKRCQNPCPVLLIPPPDAAGFRSWLKGFSCSLEVNLSHLTELQMEHANYAAFGDLPACSVKWGLQIIQMSCLQYINVSESNFLFSTWNS